MAAATVIRDIDTRISGGETNYIVTIKSNKWHASQTTSDAGFYVRIAQLIVFV